MAFVSFSDILKEWVKKKNFKNFLEKEEAIKKLKDYFYQLKNYSQNEVKIVDFKNGELKIKCLKSVIASKLRMEEKEMKDYFSKNFQIEIKRFLYQL